MQEQADERISVRLETNTINEIDAKVKEMGYPNRSEFLRTAVRTHIEGQQKKNAISVNVNSLLLDSIDNLVKRGFYDSREDALKKAITTFFTGESLKREIEDTELQEILAGRKVGVDLESSTSRQIVTK